MAGEHTRRTGREDGQGAENDGHGSDTQDPIIPTPRRKKEKNGTDVIKAQENGETKRTWMIRQEAVRWSG